MKNSLILWVYVNNFILKKNSKKRYQTKLVFKRWRARRMKKHTNYWVWMIILEYILPWIIDVVKITAQSTKGLLSWLKIKLDLALSTSVQNTLLVRLKEHMLACDTTHKMDGPDLFTFMILHHINVLDCDSCLTKRERSLGFKFSWLQNHNYPYTNYPHIL